MFTDIRTHLAFCSVLLVRVGVTVAVQWPYSGRTVAVTVAVTVAITVAVSK